LLQPLRTAYVNGFTARGLKARGPSNGTAAPTTLATYSFSNTFPAATTVRWTALFASKATALTGGTATLRLSHAARWSDDGARESRERVSDDLNDQLFGEPFVTHDGNLLGSSDMYLTST